MGKAEESLWEDGLLDSAVRISQQEIWNAFSSPRWPIHPIEDRYGTKYYYYFSKPVIIRNGALAIFRLMEMEHPSAGYSFYFVYEKEQGAWVQRMWVLGGAF
jgi:hypothetical protein